MTEPTRNILSRNSAKSSTNTVQELTFRPGSYRFQNRHDDSSKIIVYLSDWKIKKQYYIRNKHIVGTEFLDIKQT